MKNSSEEPKEPVEIFLNSFRDDRGIFLETFNAAVAKSCGNVSFVQKNMSVSKKNVFRGLHLQYDPPMGKLVQCTVGRVIDFCVNLDKSSLKFGQVHTFLLDSPEKMVYIPTGFAHGFLSLEENSILCYNCTSYYNQSGEISLSYKIVENSLKEYVMLGDIILSDRDKNAISLKEYKKK